MRETFAIGTAMPGMASAPDLLSPCFKAQTPAKSSADWTESVSLNLTRPCKMMNEVNGPCKTTRK